MNHLKMSTEKYTKSLNVNEIFYSIQGEGCWTGSPMVFIRLAGCDQECDFCDTDHSIKMNLTVERIIEEVNNLNKDANVCITGGEPTLQRNFKHLVDGLNKAQKFIHVETYKGVDHNMFPSPNWITVSPKNATDKQMQDLFYDLDKGNRVQELKLLVGDGKEYWKLIVDNKKFICNKVLLQPVKDKDYKENLRKTIKLVKQYPKLFRLSAQLHMLLNLP